MACKGLLELWHKAPAQKVVSRGVLSKLSSEAFVNSRLQRVYFHESPFIVNGTHERSPVLSINCHNVLWHAKGYSNCGNNPSPKEAKLVLGAHTVRGCARTPSNTVVVW